MEVLVENLLALTGKHITEEDIAALESVELNYEYTRQSGKTTVLVHTVETIMLFLTRLFDMPIYVGLFAPQREQAKTDFDRLKNALSISRKVTVVTDESKRRSREESNAKTLVLDNGASCYIFPVTPASNPESKTLHIILLEEAQDMIDTIVNQQIIPMGAATNAPVIRVGTAGTQTCDFYWAIQKGNAYVMQWPEIVADRRAMYEATGDASHLVYEQRVKRDIEKYGENDPRIQRPYYNVWQLEAGMYITGPELFAGRVMKPYENPAADPQFKAFRDWFIGGRHTAPSIDEYGTSHNIAPSLLAQYRTWCEENHYFGLDTAKETDQTVMKIGRVIDAKLTIIRSIQGLRGLNYQDQFELLKAELAPFKVAAGSIDSTGQGSFMPDLFERGTDYKIYQIPFSRQSKDHLYTSLYQKQVNGGFAYYAQDPMDNSAEQFTAKATAEFEAEFLALTKNYIGEHMVVKHPNEGNAHDDHPDSTALLSNAYDSYNAGSGLASYYKERLQDMKTEQPPGPKPQFRGVPHV